MKKFLILIVLISVVFTGCSKKRETNKNLNGNELRKLVLNGVNGESSAIALLRGLIDSTLPGNQNYNFLTIDSITAPNGKNYYSALLAYPNPVYNRFGVYDKDLNVMLIDKSLNGKLAENVIKVDGFSFFKIVDGFISKDDLILNRLSLYKADSNTVQLVFRSFTRLKKNDIEYKQTITELSPDRIKTEMQSTKPSEISNKADVYSYDETLNKYISANEVFYNFVTQQISNYENKNEKHSITDAASAKESLGLPAENTNSESEGFNLMVGDDWDKLHITITQYLNKEFKGVKFLNNKLGASFSIVQLPPTDSAEIYIKYKLTNVAAGKYKVRFSDQIESGRNFVQFFEYTCGEKNYLMIFESSKYTYTKYKKLYEDIINTFTLDC